eukprot:8158179-Pyramimonas_sp.AAC.1
MSRAPRPSQSAPERSESVLERTRPRPSPVQNGRLWPPASLGHEEVPRPRSRKRPGNQGPS